VLQSGLSLCHPCTCRLCPLHIEYLDLARCILHHSYCALSRFVPHIVTFYSLRSVFLLFSSCTFPIGFYSSSFLCRWHRACTPLNLAVSVTTKCIAIELRASVLANLARIQWLSLRSRMCRLFHSAISSGFASAGPKSDLELVLLDLAPENHIPTTGNDSKSA